MYSYPLHMRNVGQLHVPTALPREKSLQYHRKEGWVDPRIDQDA